MTSKFLARALAACAALAVPTVAASAQETTIAPAPDLQRAGENIAAALLRQKAPEEVFAPAFLAAVPPTQLQALTAQIAAQFGALQGLEGVTTTSPGQGVVALRFERAIYSGPFAVGPDGKVVGMLLNDYRPVGDDQAAIERDLASLPGRAGAYYGPLDGTAPRIAVASQQQFALGSTFKLYVLAALAKEVTAGKRRWDDVVRLDPVRSLPSGQMQNWPAGAPVTLQTLATMMISISDNTATDQLIRILGRDTLAAEVRATRHSGIDRTLPFLTTREMFALKADPARGAAYAAAPEARQGELIEALAQEIARDPAAKVPFNTAPTLVEDVEWFASADDLRALLGELAALEDPTAREIMAVSPSMAPAARSAWVYTGYKGGSEPGVLNLTWLLQKPDGKWWMLTLNHTNPAAPVETAALELLAQRILALP